VASEMVAEICDWVPTITSDAYANNKHGRAW